MKRSIDEFIGTEFRSRYVNPKWIEGMKKEGYAGAIHAWGDGFVAISAESDPPKPPTVTMEVVPQPRS